MTEICHQAVDLLTHFNTPAILLSFLLITSVPSQKWSTVKFSTYINIYPEDNSKMLFQISFKLGTHMYLGQDRTLEGELKLPIKKLRPC